MAGKIPFYKRAWDFLGSRDLSVFTFVMGMTYFLILTIFATVVPLPWVTNISKLLPYKVLYILFFINLLICEIKWIPVIIRKCGIPKPPETAEELERFGHRVAVRSQELGVGRLERYLKRRGYRVRSWESGVGSWESKERMKDEGGRMSSSLIPHPASLLLYAYRGRFSPIGNLLFHLSFLILFSGVMVSMIFRFEGMARVTEGHRFSGLEDEYSPVSASPFGALPRAAFFLERITPRFWEGALLFTDLRADVRYDGGKGSIWMSSPLNIGGADVTTQGVGIAPLYILKDGAGREIDSGYVNLAIFAPGTEDYFQIPGYPYSIGASFYPNHEMRNGKIVNLSMEPENPAYLVKVSRLDGLKGEVRVFSGVIRPGEDAPFDGLRLSFPEYRYWGSFRIVRDPGLPFIWLAFVLMIAGLIWRLIIYRREVAVWVGEGGSISICGHSDYCRDLFRSGLQGIAEA